MSLKQTKQNLVDSLNDLQNVTDQLTEDFKRLEAIPGKEKFAHFKKGQVNSLIGLRGSIEQLIEEFTTQYQKLFDQNKSLRNELNKTEVVSLIHGIYDLKKYTSRTYESLLVELNYINEERSLQVPIGILFAADTEKLHAAFLEPPNFTIDKNGKKVIEQKEVQKPKTTTKPVTSFKDFQPTKQN